VNEVTELVRERVGVIVTRGLDTYGYFPVEEDKRRFYTVAVDLLLSVTSRIENGEVATLAPLRNELVAGVFALGFDSGTAAKLFELVFASLYVEIDASGLIDPDTVRTYRKYQALLAEALTDVANLLRSGVPEYLSGIPEYGVSDTVVQLPPTRSRLLGANRRAVVPAEFTYRSRLAEGFSSVFDRAVSARADIVSNAAPDINAVTSDSELNAELPAVDESLLTATFAGEGNKIYGDVKRLYAFVMELGGFQGSLVGAVDYQARYYEYVMAMSYGKRLPGGVVGGDFGRFEEIYEQRATETAVPGLRFLEPIYTTRSGNQSVERGNPVAARYGNGLTDRYVSPALDPDRPDFVSLTLESVYVLCLRVGDAVRSLLNRPPVGIGDTALHLSALSRVFPQSADVRERSTGFTGAVGSLLSAHRSLYALLGYEPNLHDFDEKFKTVSGLIASLTDTLRVVGFRPGGYVPSLELTVHEPDRSRIASRLAAIGFNPVEVQEIMSVGSMSELVDRFAPLTDSQDVVSFFRAYDLTKLLYEFGGQAAIDQYTDFLYGVNPDTALLRLLELLDRGRSLASKVRGSEFSRLIGYVVTLTYAVDPAQLGVLNDVLRRNNLDLFQSITQLVKRGLPTVIKDRDSVSLLSGMVAQMVTVDNSGYESQKPLWNELIEASAGNIGPGVAGLYDRADGITPTELYAYLGGPSATSPMGKLLDGVRGGRMTSLLRYCNLFGLLYSLSGYRNSGQLINQSADNYTLILELLDNLETLSDRLRTANIILEEFAAGSGTESVYTDPVVQVQNKEFGAMISLVGGGAVTRPIAESPGIGNSRVPNGLRISNSLTPEEAAVIADAGSGLGVFTRSAANPVESGSYIRIAVSNLLASGIDVGAGVGLVTGSAGAVDESSTLPVADYTTTYQGSQPAAVGGSDPLANVPTFDPIESCRRFGGGAECAELGYDPDRLCSRPFSRALFPEDGYGTAGVGGVANVPVDRPLGSSLAGNVTYTPVPATHPQHTFTANGLSALSRSDVFKDSEMLCASLKDPYQYGACISLLKCKRFDPPYEGRYSFAFCPSTLHGGRLRR
jgi:hypothetical protein